MNDETLDWEKLLPVTRRQLFGARLFGQAGSQRMWKQQNASHALCSCHFPLKLHEREVRVIDFETHQQIAKGWKLIAWVSSCRSSETPVNVAWFLQESEQKALLAEFDYQGVDLGSEESALECYWTEMYDCHWPMTPQQMKVFC